MIEIYKYDIRTGKETVWFDEEYFYNDGDINYRNRYITSLNICNEKSYYWYVPVFQYLGLMPMEKINDNHT